MTVTASIEIAAPPAIVREKFLDFASLPKYHKDFFVSITPLGPLEPGNTVRVVFTAQKMDALILYNNASSFAWRGSIPLLFIGDHSFHFDPSTSTPGGTTFTQKEVFSGALGFLMGDNLIGRHVGFAEKTKKGWEGYNRDFKKWCEEGA